MKRISWEMTLVEKRVVPAFMVQMVVAVIWGVITGAKGAGTSMLAMPIFVGLWFLFHRLFVVSLADEVWDIGDALLIKRDGIEERVLLADICDVSGPTILSLQVELTLRSESRLGRQITFLPIGGRGFLYLGNSMVNNLAARVEQARHQRALGLESTPLRDSTNGR